MTRKMELRMCKTCGVIVVDLEAHDRLHDAGGLGPALYDSRELTDTG